MLPEVEIYFETAERLRQEYTEKRQRYYNDLGATQELNRQYDKGIDEARELLANSENKLIAWIGKGGSDDYRVWDYPEHTEEILRILPTSSDALDDFAAAQGWCSTFSRFKQAAINDGALFEPHVQYRVNDSDEWNRMIEVNMPNGKRLMADTLKRRLTGVREIVYHFANDEKYTFRMSPEPV